MKGRDIPRHMEALRLRFEGGLTYREIGVRLGVTRTCARCKVMVALMQTGHPNYPQWQYPGEVSAAMQEEAIKARAKYRPHLLEQP